MSSSGAEEPKAGLSEELGAANVVKPKVDEKTSEESKKTSEESKKTSEDGKKMSEEKEKLIEDSEKASKESEKSATSLDIENKAEQQKPKESSTEQEEPAGDSAYIVVSISGTGGEQTQYTAKDASEIIEIAWKIVSAKDLTEIASGDELVKPINTPITPLCTSLTGLTWSSVKDAKTLKDAIEKFNESIQQHLIAKKTPFSFVTFTSWDLRMRLPKEAREKSIQLPDYTKYPRYFDLRKEFVKYQEATKDEFYSNNSINEISVAQVVETLGIDVTGLSNRDGSRVTVVSGTGGSSPSDVAEPKLYTTAAKNTSLLVEIIRKLKEGAKDGIQLLSKPHDMGLDLSQFYADASRILYITNLPLDVTQSELESWFTQFGCKPMAFWTIKAPLPEFNNGNGTGIGTGSSSGNGNGNINNGNGNIMNSMSNGNDGSNISMILRSTCSGFVIFASHETAAESLAMNGRVLNDRIIEVQPSSPVVLDKAQEILTPFPSSKNRPRPGDWTCPSCGFSNFQRRTACFRCSFPATSAQTVQESKFGGNSYYGSNGGSNNGNMSSYAGGSYTSGYGRGSNGSSGSNTNSMNNMNNINNMNSMNNMSNMSNMNNMNNMNNLSNMSTLSNFNNMNNQHHHQHQNNHRNMHQGVNNGNNNSSSNGNRSYNNYNNQNGMNNGGRQQIGSSNVPFRAGDWKCMNENCAYHNFAKNVCCLKCGAPRVASAILTGHPHTPRHNNGNNSGSGMMGRINSGYGVQTASFRTQNVENQRSYSQPYSQPSFSQFMRPMLSQGSTPILGDSSVDKLSTQISGLNLNRPDQGARAANNSSQLYGTLSNLSGSTLSLNPNESNQDY